MIILEHVTFAYEKSPVLRDLCLSVEDGESVGIIGSNGAGKSTLMKALLGLIFTEGRIIIDDIEVKPGNIPRLRRKLGYVMQNSDDQMFMPTVREDMNFGLLNAGMSREEAEKRTDETLEMLDISYLKDRYNHKISGGEKRMAAIAVILAMRPDILLLDEPTGALDPYARRRVINTLNALPQTKLITSHDLDMICDTCGKVILLSHGEVAAQGDTMTIMKDRKLLEENRLELPLRYTLQK